MSQMTDTLEAMSNTHVEVRRALNEYIEPTRTGTIPHAAAQLAVLEFMCREIRATEAIHEDLVARLLDSFALQREMDGLPVPKNQGVSREMSQEAVSGMTVELGKLVRSIGGGGDSPNLERVSGELERLRSRAPSAYEELLKVAGSVNKLSDGLNKMRSEVK